jgi:hypothetical protein
MAAPLAAEAAGGTAVAGGTAEGAAGGTLRTPRTGGGAMAMDRKNRPPKPAASAPAGPSQKKAPSKPTPAQAPEQDSAPEETEPERRGERRGLPNPGGAVRDGSWIVLGFLGWVWVALPFIKSGPGGVRDVLAAKFLNRTPGGSS